ncbi:hypothetical protein RDT67_01190 [Serratia fonticola]|uniref:Uncharacterized protein n=1 Tax=Serratia fonticola TaxID=47917 RepID=A0AAJ2DAA1_SERFO|nr:hypothetical protein [Serratia fonticola]MDQ7207729.1 hypothetical protein [Serratia fonticola]MDQ9125035.1 hypothetical protein [Serratia fonticola]HBE9077967.1 hypothetical protein [Serratia fonticola]HBE9088494.1 hypothetical protein [Serratia fonticola]HBE9150692.1 hypothetical protein [Serratia fonticola]
MELDEERFGLIASEIGAAVLELVHHGQLVDRIAIVNALESKRRAVGNTLHKGVCRDAAALVRGDTGRK